MSAVVQRKLEFSVVKKASRKPTSQKQENTGFDLRLKGVRRKANEVEEENSLVNTQALISSPRKCFGEISSNSPNPNRTPRKRTGNVDDTENNPISSPSPSKCKKKEYSSPLTKSPRLKGLQSPSRRDRTPVRTSLASRFSPLTKSPRLKGLQSPRRRDETPVRTSLASKFSQANLLEQRQSSSLQLSKQDSSPYLQAKQSFHTAKPDRLIGRDNEMKEIRGFLKSHMTKKTSGSLYISGAPGTGKTAVLTYLIDEMKANHSCKAVYLNCMSLDSSATVFGKLYTDITGKNAPTAKERLRAVEKVLTTDGPSIILVLDEIDQLNSKNQEILYTIFEWPALKKSRLILIGIANALDLTDRVLPRLQARPSCTPQLLNFAPYTRDQISAILKDRIQGLEGGDQSVIDGMALQFCARKISAVAGDMRKALDVCRRAVELVERDVKSQRVLKCASSASNSPVKQRPAVPKKIGVSHINNVLSDVYGSGSACQEQGTVPLQQKLVICSLLLMLKQGKMKEVSIGKLHEVYSKVCRGQEMTAVDQSEFQGITTLLEARGVIAIKKGKETRLSKVQLKLNERELEHTMQDKVLISTVLQNGIPKK